MTLNLEKRVEQLQLMVRDCLKRSDKLSEWEHEFMADVGGKGCLGLTLTQIKKINEIWDRVTE